MCSEHFECEVHLNVCLGITSQKGRTKAVCPSLGVLHFGSFVVGRVFFLHFQELQVPEGEQIP